MTRNNIVKVGHTKIRESAVNGVYAATYVFEKRRLQFDASGEVSSEVPFTQTLILLKLPGENRKLWLQPHERRRVLEALQEVEPLGSAKPLIVADGGEVQTTLGGGAQ